MTDETNAPEIEKRMKQVVSYHHLLLWGINDVRLALSSPQADVEAKLDALLALFPPELTEEADKITDDDLTAYSNEAREITHRRVYHLVRKDGRPLDKYDDNSRFNSMGGVEAHFEHYPSRRKYYDVSYTYKPRRGPEAVGFPFTLDVLYRKHASRILRLLVELLDNHGFLREFRKEEIGGY